MRKYDSVSCSAASASLRPHGLWPTRLLCPWDFLGKNSGVGSHSLLQRIFLTQGLDPSLLHYRQILYHLTHQGRLKPYIFLKDFICPPFIVIRLQSQCSWSVCTDSTTQDSECPSYSAILCKGLGRPWVLLLWRSWNWYFMDTRDYCFLCKVLVAFTSEAL